MIVRGKRVLLVFGSACLLSVSLVFAFAQLLDTEWTKTRLSAYLSKVLNRDVHFAGSIDLSPGLLTSLKVTSVTVRNPKSFSEEDLLRLDTVFVAVPLLDSLFSEFRIQKLAIDGVHVHLERDEQGTPNWSFGESADGDERSSSDSPLRLPRVDEIFITNVSLLSDLEADRRTLAFDTVQLNNFNMEVLNEFDVSLQIDGLPVTLKGGLSSVNRFLAGEPLTVELAALHGEAHDLEIRGDLSLVESSEILLRLSGEDLTHWNPLLRVELPGYGEYAWESKLSHDWGTNVITVEDLQWSLGEHKAEGHSEIVLLDKGLRGTVHLALDQQNLTLELESVDFKEFNAKISVDGKKLEDLESLLLTELPAFETYEIEASVSLDLPDVEQVSFGELSLRVDGNDVSGAGEFQSAPPLFKASLQSDVFDLGILNKFASKGADSDSQEDTPARIPFELFDLLDAEIDWDFDYLKTFLGVELLDAKIPFRLQGGVLRVPDFSASIFEGSFSADAELSKEAVAITLKGEQFKANPITLLADGTPVLTGDFDLDVDLRSRGDTPESILAGLNGKMHLRSENARINSGTLETVSAGLANILDPLLGNDDKAQSECILFDYLVTDGVAKSGDQIMKIGDVFFFAEGQADFRENFLTYNFNVNSSNPAFASLIPPFRAYGPINNPSFVPSVSGTVAGIADSAEGVAESAMAMMKAGGSVFIDLEDGELSGLDVCKEALRIERSRVSSQIGDLIK